MRSRRWLVFAPCRVKIGQRTGIFDVRALEIRQQESNDLLLLRIADLLGVRPDPVSRSNQQSLVDSLPIGLAQELVDVVLGDVVVGRIALGLHGPVFAIFVPKHQIYAAVWTPSIRVFIPEPHLIDLSGPLGVGFQEPFNEVLELFAPLAGIRIEAAVETGKQTVHFQHFARRLAESIDNRPHELLNIDLFPDSYFPRLKALKLELTHTMTMK